MTDQPKDDFFDSTSLIVFLFNWRKPLIIISVAAAIIASIVSLVIQEKYMSTVIMFPATSNSISKALLIEDHTGKQDILKFGEEEEAEQMLQILNSDYIRNQVVEKYDLMKHYDIDPEGKYKYTKLVEEYESNISFKRTEFMSVRIDVLDKSPDTAALIANDIAALLDSVKNRMQKERAEKAFLIVRGEYNDLKMHLKGLEDSLRSLGRLGVFDYEEQSAMLNQEYAKAIARANKAAIKALEEKLRVLGEYGGTQMALALSLDYESDKLSILKKKYDEARVDATQVIPHKFIVNNAYPAEKKTLPVRWLIVVISTISAFLIGVIAIIALENYKKLIKQQRS